jgi:hypothetical protein
MASKPCRSTRLVGRLGNHQKKGSFYVTPTTDVHQEGNQSNSSPSSTGSGRFFRAILREQIEWKPFVPFPPSARLAIAVGQPLQEGPYTIRVKVPRGVKSMPHRHPEDKIYTVISGTFYIGLGDEFDADMLQGFRQAR